MQTHPEHGEGVQANCHTDVVHDTRPEIARGNAQVPFFIGIRCFHNDRDDCQNRFEPGILQNTSLHGQEGMRVRDVNLLETVVKWPSMRNRRTAMGHNNYGPLSSKEIYEKLEKGIDGESLLTSMLSEPV